MTIALPTAAPTPAAKPCMPRSATSNRPDWATAHSSEVSVNTTQLASTIRRRPRASLIGPDTSCPAADPAMKAVMVS